MPNKSIIFVFLLLGAIPSHAQVFSENFNGNSIPSGWTVNNPNTATNWAVGTQSGFAIFPDGAAFFDDDGAGPESHNSSAKLISPIISLSTNKIPKLSFKYANKIYDLASTIKVEAFDGNSWVQVFSSSGDSGQWDIDFNTFLYKVNAYESATDIDLTPYINPNFQIRFIYDDAGDYSYGAVIDDVTIKSITFAPASPQIYGSHLSLSASSSDASVTQFDYSVVSGPCTVANGVMTSTGVGSCVIKATEAGSATSASAQATVAISPAPLTITADDKTGTYGQPLPAYTVSYSGWVNSDSPALVTTAPMVTTSAMATSPVGTYTLVPGGAVVNNNYSISYVPGTLTIDKAAQTLAFTSIPPVSAKVGGSYGVTTAPGQSTAPVVLAVAGNCSLAESTVSFDAIGSCSIIASQMGDANYLDASDATQTFSISPGNSSVSIDSTPNPSQPGQDVTFSITVSPDSTNSLNAPSSLAKAVAVPTGTVTLSDDGTTLGTATLDANGYATLTVTSLVTAGAHNIVASYAGDANFPATQSTAFTQTVRATAAPMPVPLFDELWEKLLLGLLMLGASALYLRTRRT